MNIYITIFNLVGIGIIEIIKYIGYTLIFKNYNYNYNYSFLLEKISQNNAIAVKLFQYGCSKQELYSVLPYQLISVMKSYCSNAHYTRYDIDKNTINYVENNYNIIINSNPNNSGTIGLTYICIDKTTHYKYILKIKKNNIENRLKNDVNIIITIFNILTKISYFDSITKPLNEFMNSLSLLYNQCDFENEIKSTNMCYKNALKCIKIPLIYNKAIDIVDTKFILMEYIEGHQNLNLLTFDEKHEYAKQLITYNINALFNQDIIHTDIHLGNIIFSKTENSSILGIIDFGLTYKISRDAHELLIIVYTTNFDMQVDDKIINTLIGLLFVNNLTNYGLYKNNKDIINNIFINICKLMQQGLLNENSMLLYVDQLYKILKTPVEFKSDVMNIAIGECTITNTVFVLINNNLELYSEYVKDIVLNILCQ